MRRSRFPKIATACVFFFLYIPVIILIINSFNASKYNGVWGGFSLKWYKILFSDQTTAEALYNSLIIGVSATCAATILGTAAALALHHYKTRLQKIHYGLIYSPLVIPDILMGISLLLLFISFNIDLGLLTVFLAHATFCISYVALTVLARLDQFDYSVIEAAEDLGANRWYTLYRITIPLLSPGIISGALLAFTISFDDYIITSFVAGPGATTLPLHVYGLIKFSSTPIINALSTLILAVTFTIVIVTQFFLKEREA